MTAADAAVGGALAEADRREWRRHPGDVARLVFRAIALIAVMAATALAPDALRDVSADLTRLLAQSPRVVRDSLVGLSQLTAFLLPLAVVASLAIRRRFADVAMITSATVIGGLVMSQLIDWLDRAAPPEEVANLPSDWLVGADFPSVSYVAGLIAGTAVAAPLLDQRWRRVAIAAVAAAVLFQLFTATHAPVNVLVTVALGGVVGSAVLVAVGAPRRRPGAATLRDALHVSGIPIDDLYDETVATGRRFYRGSAGGRSIRIAYVDRDDRDADLLSRILRSIRVRSIDEDTLSMRPRVTVEHEALMTMMAAQADVAVPEVVAVTPLRRDSAIIALTEPGGEPLIASDRSDVSEAALDDLWGNLGRLHEVRIAHRSLTGRRVLVDGDRTMVLGLENARPAASSEQRGADVAQLLVTTALVVGVDRAVQAAVRTMPRESLEDSIPLIQLAAMPTETRRSVRREKGIVDDIRAELESRLDVAEVEMAELDRISLMRIVTWVGFAVLAFFILTLLSGWDEIVETMQDADWAWVPWVLVATVVGVFAGAMSLAGSVVRKVPLGEATVIMFGQSFLNRFTPANAGGMAMRIRYLQKGGTDVTVATAAIGLTSAASGVLQVVFIAFFFLWSGSDPTSDVDATSASSPDLSIVIVFVAAIVVAVVVVTASKRLRTWFVSFLKSTGQKIRGDFGELARRPGKMGLLFGGAGLSKLATLTAFVFACRAFDIDLSFAMLGAMYLGASTIAAAVPTPGGVGAIEAALVFVLVNAGVDEATAWAAVLLFRLINYWLITIPGYIALKASERYDLV